MKLEVFKKEFAALNELLEEQLSFTLEQLYEQPVEDVKKRSYELDPKMTFDTFSVNAKDALRELENKIHSIYTYVVRSDVEEETKPERVAVSEMFDSLLLTQEKVFSLRHDLDTIYRCLTGIDSSVNNNEDKIPASIDEVVDDIIFSMKALFDLCSAINSFLVVDYGMCGECEKPSCSFNCCDAKAAAPTYSYGCCAGTK